MRILNKDFEQEISGLVLQKAKYQKVVVCYDKTADKQFIDRLNNKLSKQVVLINFYFNENEQDYFDVVRNGVRLVIYNVGADNYLKIKDADNYLIKVFVPTGDFCLPYLISGDSVYCDNVFVKRMGVDYLSIILLYDAGLSKLWADLQLGYDVDLDVFKKLDNIVNCKGGNVFEVVQNLASYVELSVEKSVCPYYVYLKLCYIYEMLEKFKFHEESVVDFYKLDLTPEDVGRAYAVLVKSEVVGYLKVYNEKLMRVVSALLLRVKILIKKYFKNNKINVKEINKKMRQNIKHLKIDNLLYISYLFNVLQAD